MFAPFKNLRSKHDRGLSARSLQNNWKDMSADEKLVYAAETGIRCLRENGPGSQVFAFTMGKVLRGKTGL